MRLTEVALPPQVTGADVTVVTNENAVVFVLPNKDRVKDTTTSSTSLLNSAKLLMACTPNGI